MTHPISIAHLSAIDLSPEELIEIAARCGYEFVGLRLLPLTADEAASPIVDDGASRRNLAKRARDAGVGVLDIEIFRLTPDARPSEFEPVLAAASELGARHLLTQVHDDEHDRALDAFKALCDLSRRYGLTCDLEFLSWTKMRDLAAARAFVSAAEAPNGGVCLDTLHFWRSRCRLSEIDELPANWLHYVQVCDARGPQQAEPDEMIRVAREERLLPGAGVIDLKGILSRVSPNIPLALEIPHAQASKRITHEDRMRVARIKLIELFTMLEEAAA